MRAADVFAAKSIDAVIVRTRSRGPMQIIVENLNIVQRIAARLSICAKPDNQDFSAYTIDLKAGDFIVFMIIVSPGPSIIIPRWVPEGCPATNLRYDATNTTDIE